MKTQEFIWLVWTCDGWNDVEERTVYIIVGAFHTEDDAKKYCDNMDILGRDSYYEKVPVLKIKE